MARLRRGRQRYSFTPAFSLAVVALMTACGGRAGEDVGPSPTQPIPPSNSLLSIAIADSTTGGIAVAGTVTLKSAPAADTTIALASDNPSVFVSPGARVNSRFPTADFVVSTPVVTKEITVTITATVDNMSARSTLTILPQAPMFFSYDIKTPSVTAAGRYTSDSTFFTATVDGNGIYMSLSRKNPQPPLDRWELAMTGMPMRPGTFEVLPGTDSSSPKLRVSAPPIFNNNGSSYNCSSEGRATVVIEELEYRPTGTIDKFVATIDQQCSASSHFHGEISLTRPCNLGGNGVETCLP